MKDRALRKLLGFKTGTPYFTISDISHLEDTDELECIKEIKKENAGLKINLESLNIRLKQLECKHDGEMLFDCIANFYNGTPIESSRIFVRQCAECEKMIETYKTNDEMLCAQAKWLKEKAEWEIKQYNVILKKCKA